jgi:hypothetical protein
MLVKGAGERPLEKQGFLLEEVRAYRLPRGHRDYQLFVYKKVS